MDEVDPSDGGGRMLVGAMVWIGGASGGGERGLASCIAFAGVGDGVSCEPSVIFSFKARRRVTSFSAMARRLWYS